MMNTDTRFRLLMESIRDYAIVMLDAHGRIIEWNIGAERMLGWTESEILGRHGDVFFTPEDRARGIPEREFAIARREGRAEDERWHLRKDGSRFWGSGLMYALRENGEIGGFCKVFRDTTAVVEASRERGHLLAREQGARRDAETSNRLKDEFLAVLSHELRTPLNAVLGWTRILQQTPNITAERLRHALDVIERNGRRQGQMIDELLDVSRIVSGRLTLHRSNVDLSQIVEHTVSSLRPTLEDKGLRLEIRVASGCAAYGDADRLQQIVWNLVSNAIKFTPAGGLVGVELDCTSDQGGRLTVRDTGQGIAPELLPHVFDRFRQGDSSTGRRHGGLGLGLAIVRQLAEAHGGSVTAESQGTGRGSIFTVYLPPLSQAGSSAPRAAEPAADQPADLSGVRVLVVDDEPDSLELLSVVLEGAGATVLKAEGATEALEILAREPVDVLTSDIGMPGEDGYRLIRHVREGSREPLREIPAVAVTAYVGTQDRSLALQAGFDRHIAKPIEPEQLVRVVTELAHPGP